MSSDIEAIRRESAQRRVREKQAQQMASLVQWQDEQRRADFRAQKQMLDQNATKEAALTENHRLAVERLEREWQQQRDRLACVPAPAPSYGLLPPPQKDIKSDYDRAREQYLKSKDALETQFEKDLTGYHCERADQLQAFQKANDARECGFEEDRQIKAAEQQRGFDILVHRQMQRPERSVREEFKRISRDTERYM